MEQSDDDEQKQSDDDKQEQSDDEQEEDSEVKSDPTTQAYRRRNDSKEDPKDLDKKVPWPVSFPDNKGHWKVWQKGIQMAKDKFKVDARSEQEVAKKAKEIFLQWGFSNEKKISEKVESLIREYKAENKESPEWIAFIEENFESTEMYEAGMTEGRAKEILNVIDNDKFLIRPIRESKRAGKKFVPGGLNVILTKKTKPGFQVGIDEKFLVKIIQGENQSEYIQLDANAVVYGEYGLTSTHKQKIGIWKKRMRQPGAWVEDIVELEKILKRLIKLLDITHGTIFNSGKYQTESQAMWLIGLGLGEGETLEEIQSISQFVLEDGRTFRTWMKQTDIIKACKELFEDAVDWQFWEGIINEERKQEFLESLKIVELAEQVFGANHARGKLANEINDWHPTPAIEDVICIDMKECYPATVNGELPSDDITGFAQVRSFRFVSNIHSAIPVWYGKHFACRSGEGCGKTKGWTPIVLLRYLLEAGILESVTIGGSDNFSY
ncbi:hypothetical protein GLOIN_2v1848952 [Rhizophagus clarus]|uniref:Uncharacterized protein n=1 Tax=Rhizophagus clarus TaxID=94130 RepID=A0A8H3L7P7_9GLOM|nr:hypothetical protein GLOIN_2v1848952 [Rhizophagus clarus]